MNRLDFRLVSSLVHMLGNLKACLGPVEFDSYAVWLRPKFEPAARVLVRCG
jgi:hypothetical protein